VTVDGPDEVGVALHALNNALCAGLGRIEICTDLIEEIDGSTHQDLSVCLVEAEAALLRARAQVTRIAELTA